MQKKTRQMLTIIVLYFIFVFIWFGLGGCAPRREPAFKCNSWQEAFATQGGFEAC